MRVSNSVLTRSVAALIFAMAAGGAAYGNLVHYQPFDDSTNYDLTNGGTAGGTSTAAGVYGNNSASTTDAPAALPGYSQQFAGVYYKNDPYPYQGFGGRVDIANSANTFNLDNSAGASNKAMTFSLWMKWDGDQHGVDQGIISKFTDSPGSGWGLSIGGDGLLKFGYTGANGSNRFSTVAMTSGTWQHVALSWEVGNSGGLHMYLNGADVTQYGGYVGPNDGMTANASAIHIGNLDGTYNPFSGSIDDVGMWDSVLSAGEIKSLETAPAALGDYTANKMQRLFSLYDGTSSNTSETIDGRTWGLATGLTGHSAGDTWTIGNESFIQFDALGNGVAGVVPEPASLCVLGAGAFMLMRYRRAD